MKRFENVLLVADGEYWQDTALLGDSAYGRLKNAIIDDRQDQLEKIAASGRCRSWRECQWRHYFQN